MDDITGYILTTEPTEIFNDAEVIIVGNNHLYVDDVSTFPIDFQLVDEITADLLDTSSSGFLQYADVFCDNVSHLLFFTSIFILKNFDNHLMACLRDIANSLL